MLISDPFTFAHQLYAQHQTPPRPCLSTCPRLRGGSISDEEEGHGSVSPQVVHHADRPSTHTPSLEAAHAPSIIRAANAPQHGDLPVSPSVLSGQKSGSSPQDHQMQSKKDPSIGKNEVGRASRNRKKQSHRNVPAFKPGDPLCRTIQDVFRANKRISKNEDLAAQLLIEVVKEDEYGGFLRSKFLRITSGDALWNDKLEALEGIGLRLRTIVDWEPREGDVYFARRDKSANTKRGLIALRQMERVIFKAKAGDIEFDDTVWQVEAGERKGKAYRADLLLFPRPGELPYSCEANPNSSGEMLCVGLQSTFSWTCAVAMSHNVGIFVRNHQMSKAIQPTVQKHIRIAEARHLDRSLILDSFLYTEALAEEHLYDLIKQNTRPWHSRIETVQFGMAGQEDQKIAAHVPFEAKCILFKDYRGRANLQGKNKWFDKLLEVMSSLAAQCHPARGRPLKREYTSSGREDTVKPGLSCKNDSAQSQCPFRDMKNDGSKSVSRSDDDDYDDSRVDSTAIDEDLMRCPPSVGDPSLAKELARQRDLQKRTQPTNISRNGNNKHLECIVQIVQITYDDPILNEGPSDPSGSSNSQPQLDSDLRNEQIFSAGLDYFASRDSRASPPFERRQSTPNSQWQYQRRSFPANRSYGCAPLDTPDAPHEQPYSGINVSKYIKCSSPDCFAERLQKDDKIVALEAKVRILEKRLATTAHLQRVEATPTSSDSIGADVEGQGAAIGQIAGGSADNGQDANDSASEE